MGIFVLKEKEHERFIRKGADLYIKRDISLSEALCGYTLEVEHLDGRILIIKSNPGEIITPMTSDPLSKEPEGMKFETFDDCDCGAENVAQAETEDTDACKKVCEKKGFTAFVISDGSAIFKNCTRAEALAAKKSKPGSTLYVVADPNKAAQSRLVKAVKGEGMPTPKNPFVCGNLFLILNIVFPKELDPAAVTALKKALPPPKTQLKHKEDADNVEVHYLTDMDPVESYKEASTVTERMRTTRTRREAVFREDSVCSATSSEFFFV